MSSTRSDLQQAGALRQLQMFQETPNSSNLDESLVKQDPLESSGIHISESLLEELMSICLRALPHKAFGLMGGKDVYHPKSIYPCATNLRNEPQWKATFESYGEFYRNPDLGFVISAEEVKEVLDIMASRDESFIGVFHSHRSLPAEPSVVDLALNCDPNLLTYIVSVVDPSAPVVGVFHLDRDSFQNIPILRIYERDKIRTT
jgi:proteasome lid subunit RPN8/RPN11